MREPNPGDLTGQVVTISLAGADWLFKGFYGEDWRWRNAHQPGSRDHERGWHGAAVPGSVQHDLLAQGIIPDPHFEQNSLLSEWTCQRTWLYRKSFPVDTRLQGRTIRLVFEGVDYEAEFYLNGELLGSHRGMFTPAIFDVGSRLKFGAENMLVVVIQPSPQEQPQVGRTSLVRTHKTRMNYWWDFCPRMVHQGIWDTVSLEASGPAFLDDVHVKPDLSEALDNAVVQVSCRISAIHAATGDLLVDLCLADRVLASRTLAVDLPPGTSTHTLQFTVEEPHLWWTNGAGDQSLYTVNVTLVLRDNIGPGISDHHSLHFGIRRIRFVKNEGAAPDALPYTLELNGRRLNINGWNWVPMDAMYGVERPHKLERLLALARQAHVNLLRVWGGGLIEKEAFYDLCDQLGILVWQEFIQSSSGIDNIPPVDADYLNEIVAEARQIIPRRRNHPSLAIWCGGNELMADGKPLDDSHPLLGALHGVVSELDPGRMWLPTSASGPVAGFNLTEIEKDPARLHDVHGPWEYQGLEAHYALYNQGASLYHSEFGVEGITNRRTLDSVIDPDHQFPVDRRSPNWFHLGAWWVKETTLQAAFGEFKDISQAVTGAQFLQFEGLRYAVEADRRRWPNNSGTSPWQFNEPFPMAACTSAVDYYAEPKPAYYAVRAAYEPLHLSARYDRLAWAGHAAFSTQLWSNNEGKPEEGWLDWKIEGLAGKAIQSGRRLLVLAADQAQPLGEVTCPLGLIPDDLFFLTATFSSADGKMMPESRWLFSKAESLSPIFSLPPAQVRMELTLESDRKNGFIRLENIGSTAALGLWLENDRTLDDANYAYFDRNYFHLLPGEEVNFGVVFTYAGDQEPSIHLSGWNINPTRTQVEK